MLADKEKCRFQMVYKGQNNVRNYKFLANISVSIFKFSPFLYTMKAWRWNRINFLKFANALIRKDKKHSCSSQWEKKNWEKFDFD